MSRPRKVHVKSFGCQMNVYDSHRMADTLAPAGFVETSGPEDADLVILNTCHIREKAAEKVYSEIGRIREMKEAAARDGRHMIIAVAGCLAQAEGKEIIRRAGAVDLVVGSQNYHRLPDMIARARKAGIAAPNLRVAYAHLQVYLARRARGGIGKPARQIAAPVGDVEPKRRIGVFGIERARLLEIGQRLGERTGVKVRAPAR